MKFSLRAHPSWVIYNLIWGFLIVSLIPLDNNYLWLWDAIFKVKNAGILLTILFLVGGAGLWGSWRLLTNGLSKRPPTSIWSNVWWWLFLYSYPFLVFNITFLFPNIPETLKLYSALFGFISWPVVAILSGKLIPMPKDMINHEEGSFSFSPAAFSKSAEQIIPNHLGKKHIPVLHIGKQTTQETKLPALEEKETIPSSSIITPLLGAIITGDIALVQTALADHPEELNIAYAQNGNTPLHVAALNGYTDIVRLLLEQPEIDTPRTNNAGQTALDLAREKGFEEIAQLLEK